MNECKRVDCVGIQVLLARTGRSASDRAAHLQHGDYAQCWTASNLWRVRLVVLQLHDIACIAQSKQLRSHAAQNSLSHRSI